MASKSISKSVVWQLISKFALQGIAFITTPIFTRLLTPADYGYTALYYSWCSILGLIVGLQTYGSIQNALLKYDSSEIKKYYSSVMSISFLSFIIVLLLFVIFNDFFANIFSIRKDLVILLALQSFGIYIITFKVSEYDANKEVEKSTFLSCFQSIISIGLSLVLVFMMNFNRAIGKIYGQAIPIVVIGFIILISIYIKGRCFWNNSYNLFCLKLTLPLILHGLGHLIFSQSDRVMLAKMSTEEELGIYSVVFSLCSVLSIIFGALNSSWIPFYYEFKKNNKKDEIIQHSERYLKFFSLIVIGFSLLAYDVFKIMAPASYNEGLKIIPFFVISLYFNFLYLFPVNFEFYNEKTKVIPVATLISALINIGVNFVLIPYFGIIGAAAGTMLAHICLFIIHWLFARFLLREEFEYKFCKFVKWIILVLVAAIISYVLKDRIVIRWIMAIMAGVIIIVDIARYRSIF